MKDQYFGDINDYRKYGLLRAFFTASARKLLVAWMLTPNDGRRDGAIRTYLNRPEKWRRFDPELFDGLARLRASSSKPRVSLIESARLLPGTKFYSAVVPDSRGLREHWRDGLIKAASGADLVLLDPDNGIEVPSRPAGRKDSSKYVFWEEIRSLWAARCSLLIYQHWRREPREAFAEHISYELWRRTGAPYLQAIRTPRVLFLLAGQQRHEDWLRGASSELDIRWAGQIEIMRA